MPVLVFQPIGELDEESESLVGVPPCRVVEGRREGGAVAGVLCGEKGKIGSLLIVIKWK